MNKIILNLDLREGLFTLNEGTIEALGRPRQVQILINMQEKMLVLRACGTEDIEAVVLPSEKTMATAIGARSIMEQIKQKMNWTSPRKRSLHYPASRFPLRWTAKRIKMKMHR